jgi:peptidoglycan/LPS O-acetylase OafA/YrhL
MPISLGLWRMPGKLGRSLRSARVPISPSIEGGFSLYLDAVRFIAALSVFLAHTRQHHLFNGWVPLAGFDHEAVIVFFVLSGLVISSTAARPQETLRSYAIARSCRIYSVAIPAIILAVTLQGVAALIYPSTQDHGALYQSTSSILFISESWHQGALLPWNAPYWSLCYEVWYYVIFGTLFFAKNQTLATIGTAVAAMVAGPAILILLPVWWLGVWIAQHPTALSFSKSVGFVVLFATIGGIALLNWSGLAEIVGHFLHDNIPLFWRLDASQRFLTDYLVGLLVTLNFVAFRALRINVAKRPLVAARVIKFLAGYTFSLYLYHYPMICFYETLFPNSKNSLSRYAVTATTIFMLCIILGHFTEKQKWMARAIILQMVGLTTRSVALVRNRTSMT